MKKKTGPSGETRDHESHGQTNNDRRGTLKRLVLGSAAAGVAASLPARWTQPIVQSVLLPAHAQTSPGDIEDGDFFAPLFVSADDRLFPDNETEVASQSGWLDWLIPSAHAGGVRPPEVICEVCGICARIQGGRVTVNLVGITYGGLTVAELCYEATGNIGGTASFSQVEGPSDACPVPTNATIVRLEGEAPNRTLVVSGGSEDIMLGEDPSRNCNCNAFSCFR